MALQKRNNERGMVLLIVLLVITLLVTILVEFSFSTLVDLRLAETYRDTTRAHYLAKGGIRVGRMILQDDGNSYDALNETWAQATSPGSTSLAPRSSAGAREPSKARRSSSQDWAPAASAGANTHTRSDRSPAVCARWAS